MLVRIGSYRPPDLICPPGSSLFAYPEATLLQSHRCAMQVVCYPTMLGTYCHIRNHLCLQNHSPKLVAATLPVVAGGQMISCLESVVYARAQPRTSMHCAVA